MQFRGDMLRGGAAPRCSAALLLPFLVLHVHARAGGTSKFGAQFPDAMDIIVRSLRAGHPVPVAIGHGGAGNARSDRHRVRHRRPTRSPTAPIVETAMRNLYFRVGQEDLPLFVTAVAIQGSTGGNLSEILENLSAVIRQRFKMRRKIKALAAGRQVLGAVPVVAADRDVPAASRSWRPTSTPASGTRT